MTALPRMSRLPRLAVWLGAGLLALCLLALPVHAQLTQDQQEYVQEWLETAERAENAIEAGRASNVALEHLRAEVATYREGFERAQSQNTARIGTLQSQLDALGPAPEDGQTEPEEIATLRADLNARIQTLRVPIVVAYEAYSRADGIIREIDRIIRERQRAALLNRTDTPLNPALWPGAGRQLSAAADEIAHETQVNWERRSETRLLRQTLPQALFLVVVGLVLVVRGRRWAEQAGAYMRRLGGRGFGVWGFLISLGRIILPLIGTYTIVQGISTAGILGLRGDLILNSLPFWAAQILMFLWLADRLYPKRAEDELFGLDPAKRPAARRNYLWLGIVLVLHDMADLFGEIENASYATQAVIGFPVILLGSAIVLRIRRLTQVDLDGVDDEDTTRRTGLAWMTPVFSWTSGVVAVAAPLMAAAGYGALAEAILFPYILTMGIYAGLLVLQAFFSDLYAWLSGKGAEAAETSVVPVLTGFALALLSLPVLAMVWGAREADLSEAWNSFLQGVRIGDSQISPVDFLTFAIVFAIGYTITRMFQNALKNSLLPRTKLDQGGRNAVVSGTGYVGIFLAALIAVSTAGIDLSSLAIVAGALSVGIGFGLQTIVSNFVSGIILLIERPVAEGDWIEVGGNMGYVRDISVRSTRIETFDRTDVIVPNSDLISGTVTNYTRGNTIGRLIVPVGVAYGTDTKLVESILREVAEAHPMVLGNPAPYVVFQGFGADSLDFEIRAILRDVNWVLSVKSEMNHQINARFTEAGIEIPFAQRDLWIRNPETLRAATSTGPISADAGRPVPPDLQDLGDLSDGDGDADADGGGDR